MRIRRRRDTDSTQDQANMEAAREAAERRDVQRRAERAMTLLETLALQIAVDGRRRR